MFTMINWNENVKVYNQFFKLEICFLHTLRNYFLQFVTSSCPQQLTQFHPLEEIIFFLLLILLHCGVSLQDVANFMISIPCSS